MSDNNNATKPATADRTTCPTCGRPISAPLGQGTGPRSGPPAGGPSASPRDGGPLASATAPVSPGIAASGPVGPGNGSSLLCAFRLIEPSARDGEVTTRLETSS